MNLRRVEGRFRALYGVEKYLGQQSAISDVAYESGHHFLIRIGFVRLELVVDLEL